MKKYWRVLLILYLLIWGNSFGIETIRVSRNELKEIGEKIYLNETGGKKEQLVHWNTREEFASLGIGHFIWYPKGYEGPYSESFPGLVEEYRNRGIVLPKLLEENNFCPWNSQNEFLKVKNSQEVGELIEFLNKTKQIQVMYIYKRLEKLIKNMSVSNNSLLKKNFYRVVSSKNGLYPIIDYINFKGEGNMVSERYDGYGWGLLQVLEEMDIDEGDNGGVIEEFADSAKYVLARRVGHSQKHRKEVRWIPGWYSRIDTYTK